MKKSILHFLLALVMLTLTFSLAGCGNNEEQAPAPKPEAAAKPDPAKEEAPKPLDEAMVKRLRSQLAAIDTAYAAFGLDSSFKETGKRPETLDDMINAKLLTPDPEIKLEYQATKTAEGKNSFIATAYSPDGKYKMVYDKSKDTGAGTQVLNAELVD